MKRIFGALLAASMTVPIVGSAYAQGAINLMNEERRRTADELERDQKIEKEYKNEMKKIPDQKQSSDPWGTVRSSDTTKSSTATTTTRKPRQN